MGGPLDCLRGCCTVSNLPSPRQATTVICFWSQAARKGKNIRAAEYVRDLGHPVLQPSNRTIPRSYQPLDPPAVDRAIEKAATTQKIWAVTSFRERRAVLRSMLQHVLDNQEMICKVACLDSGKNMVDAQMGEILVTAEKLQWTIEHGKRALAPSRRPTNLLLSHKRNIVSHL
ncbi:hypothetical protein BKA67DRAFT_537437 [Truncatella angustata]|uniref:Aldehyde dehydrogenase domain-containing protein n=1 Tax=Truncatella angustata TaxID=152316 RepID=A0A9P8ZUZ5_9PEZI|nr:uncharacterized protein BKA67DRAFT_537437 [Truncatella angustata]KAH6651571.1 hypothetical protein BKA67DRAFT_537437 [Truncatella angustata]